MNEDHSTVLADALARTLTPSEEASPSTPTAPNATAFDPQEFDPQALDSNVPARRLRTERERTQPDACRIHGSWIPFLRASIWAAGYPSRVAGAIVASWLLLDGPDLVANLVTWVPPSPHEVDPFSVPRGLRCGLLEQLTKLSAQVPCPHRYAQLQLLRELWRGSTEAPS
jgi:hypothetical protein